MDRSTYRLRSTGLRRGARAVGILCCAVLLIGCCLLFSASAGGSAAAEENSSLFSRTLVTLYCDGELTAALTDQDTVGGVLEEQDIALSENDLVNYDLTDPVSAGMLIRVVRVTSRMVEIDTPIRKGTVTITDPSLRVGRTVVLTEGADGVRRARCELVYHDGVEYARMELSSEVLRLPVSSIVCRGTLDPDTLTEHETEETVSLVVDAQDCEPRESRSLQELLQNVAELPYNSVVAEDGTVYLYSRKLRVEATAYTCEGSDWNITATGTTARVGEIAVDPSVISLGSTVYVVSDDGYCDYGICTAEDTGGAIKGNRVDLYFDTYDECIQFGRRSATVYVITGEYET